MLRALELKDLVIVERASLEFDAGFAVLTGETGAGKSMLVDAIELLVGGRGDGALVREGADKADLSAEFEFRDQSSLGGWLSEHDLLGDPGRVLLRRSIDRAGRSRCFINGHSATLAQLREAGEFLVDIHGQHAHQSLLRAAAQRELLDAHAEAGALAAQTAAAFKDWKRLEALAREAASQYEARQAERAVLSDAVLELKRLNPAAGEWERIAAEHTRLQHGSSLLAGAESALEALAEADGAALSQLAAITGRLRALAEHDARLAVIVEMLAGAEAQAGEAARELRHYASRVELDPDALREVEARIEALHAAGRRYRVRPEALPAHFAGLQQRLAELDLAGDPQALQREVTAAQARFADAAKALSARRASAARELGRAVTSAMQALAMAGGKFVPALRKLDEPAASGLEAVEFEVSSHPSLPPRPLAKVASGGELSRISLAIQMVAARAAPVGTLVFDEVDAGIGGAVAASIGRALKKLGKERQVLCVTHLPQVAAHAEAQWSVEKSGSKSGVKVKVARLDREGRIEELARMLGGTATTARRHATELLDAG